MYFITIFVYITIIITSKINADEFIVKYTKWFNKKERLKILTKELPDAQVYDMDEVSDFDTISLNSSKCCNQFHVHSNIDQVITNKMLRFTKPASSRQGSGHKSIDVTKLLNTSRIWSLGYTGKNVKVAVVDTGLNTKQKFVKNLAYQINFTNETDFNDSNGHGTFITSIIASSNAQLLGLAPDVDLYILRTFDRNLKSFTSWFLRAFNFILMKKIHVVNLSLGSIDFTDTIFVNKIQELVANNIVIVSAAGNNGPIFGTINNPADQIEVIGVGSLGRLSSRGMTTWELPEGIGRLKPDIVTFGDNILGIGLKNKRTVLSGSSVASAVITGAVALLLSYKFRTWNVGFVKQALMNTADRYMYPLDEFHQGFGQLNLFEAFKWFRFKSFQITLSPSSINFLDCPYQWMNCIQPIYYTAMPYMFNITVINSIRKKSKITAIVWEPYDDVFGANLNVSCDYSNFLWLWHGYISVYLSVNKNWLGIIEGRLRIVIDYDYITTLPIKVKVIETPPRSKRLLWDQYHNLQYPKHCIMSDDLENLDKQPVDWTGDHLYTNFRQLYNHLRSNSYYVEVLTQRYNCFNATNYGALIILDPEEPVTVEETIKLQNDVNDRNLSLIIFADWNNDNLLRKFDVFEKKKFFNCKKALMAGANLNSLNYLLKNWSIELSNDVFSGNFSIGNHRIHYRSGTSINIFPNASNGGVLYAADLKRVSFNNVERVPILGFFRNLNRGKIAIFGDSNCLDEIFNEKLNCYWLMDIILQFALNGHVSGIFQHNRYVFDGVNVVDVNKTFFASSNQESCKTLTWLNPNLIKSGPNQTEESLLNSLVSQQNQQSPWFALVLIISLSFFILFMFKYLLRVKFLK